MGDSPASSERVLGDLLAAREAPAKQVSVNVPSRKRSSRDDDDDSSDQPAPRKLPDENCCPRCARRLKTNPSSANPGCQHTGLKRCAPCVGGNRAGCFVIKEPRMRARVSKVFRDVRREISAFTEDTEFSPDDLSDALRLRVDQLYHDLVNYSEDASESQTSGRLAGFVTTPKRARDAGSSSASSNGVASELATVNRNIRAVVDTMRVFNDMYARVNNVRRGSYYDEGSDDSNGGGGASRARRSKVNITVRRRSDASDEEMT